MQQRDSGLDTTKLENVRQLSDGSIKAACPACRADESDSSGDHLLIKPDGSFGCAVHAGEREHRKEIFRLAGKRSPITNGHANGNGSPPRIVATYDYPDETGKLRFQVCRIEPKGFFQRRPDGNGGWIRDTKGVEKVLFRLPEILRDVQHGLPIFQCEGEKDVLAMVEKGFSATCNPGGARKWQDSFSETLRGADVIVIADKDKDGREHGQLVASKLHGVAKSVRVIELPGDNVKDAHDFFASGGEPAELDEIAQAAPLWTPAKDEPKINCLPEIVDAAAFMAVPQDMPPELIAGVLHKGSKLALGGSSKAYKSWLLLDMAVSVAHGLPWLGFETALGKVLFVNFEIQSYAWQRRIAAVTRAKGLELQPGQISLWNLRGHAADFTKLVPRIIERAKQQSFSLIILDPIYKIYGGTDENSAGDVAALLNSIERLTVETGAAVTYGCHFAKGNASAKEAIDRISGSGVFARDPDSLLIFTAHEDEGCFTVDPILRNFAPIHPFVARWKYPLFESADELDPAKLKQVAGKKKQHDPVKLLAAVANNDELNPISMPQWADRTEIPRTTLNDYVTEMRRKGWVKTIGEGSKAKQAITNKGKAILNECTPDGN